MAVDSQLPTSDSLSDGQIIEMVNSSSQSSQAGSDEDQEGKEEGASMEEERISSSTVVNAIDKLMRYFDQCQLTVGLYSTYMYSGRLHFFALVFRSVYRSVKNSD